jgi:hypothetical protein
LERVIHKVLPVVVFPGRIVRKQDLTIPQSFSPDARGKL